MGDTFVEGGKNGKGKEKERRKGERKKEKRTSVCSSSARRRSNGWNSSDQEVKSVDKSYVSRDRDSSYFGLFLSFGLLFWADLGPCCAMFMA